jgi:predicted metalloprotease with PDZ domain
MLNSRRLFLALRVIGLLLIAGSTSLTQTHAQNGGTRINFTVSMSKPHTHLLEVEMRVSRGLAAWPKEDVLVMPVWTPGSYMVREFARHVQDFAATDQSGRPLEWEKINKSSWRVKTNGITEWRVTYRVYANELTVRTSELNSDHAFWNNAALLMYLEKSLKQPTTLQINPAPGWKIATGLPPVPGEKNTFSAENFDVLYDSPVEVSNFRQLDFKVRGVPHRIVIDGEGNYHAELLRAMIEKIVETEIALFGDIPYHDYTFILHLRANTGGGLEHLNSTALGFRRAEFATESGYRRFASLVAHEFFHLWNVKRIRPDALGPFDYQNENYTRLLWVAEGITEYYANLMLRRSGLISDQSYLNQMAANIQGLQETPGRLLMSAEESSFDAWIKFYRPDENSVNTSISYYDKGEILGLLLDLEIRRRTKGAKSLDDVMRVLYNDFYKKGRNYSPADFQKVCETVAGGSLEEFFARYVRGRDELPYNQILAAAGLRLEQAGVKFENLGDKLPEGVPVIAFLGADLDDNSERLVIKAVRSGTPAYEQGLNANDQIVALDGMRVTNDTFAARLAEKRPGDTISLTISRFDDLRTFDIRLGSRINAPYQIVGLPDLTEEQKRIYQAWMAQNQ